jgi:hypothetical protein
MKYIKTEEALRAEQMAEQKAALLTAKYGVKVVPIAFLPEYENDTADKEENPVRAEEYLIGFFKEPNRIAKVRALDASEKNGSASAGSLLVEACLIKEESHPLIERHDAYYLGASLAALHFVQFALEQFKKK